MKPVKLGYVILMMFWELSRVLKAVYEVLASFASKRAVVGAQPPTDAKAESSDSFSFNKVYHLWSFKCPFLVGTLAHVGYGHNSYLPNYLRFRRILCD